MDEGKTIDALGLCEYEKIELKGKQLILLYKDMHKPEDNCDGFYFSCLEFYSQVVGSLESDIKYTVLFDGVAHWDGVRHFYAGSEETGNYGYLYYVDLPDLIMALKALDDLQVSKCKYISNQRLEEQKALEESEG